MKGLKEYCKSVFVTSDTSASKLGTRVSNFLSKYPDSTVEFQVEDGVIYAFIVYYEEQQ
jgi:hypothetical protein